MLKLNRFSVLVVRRANYFLNICICLIGDLEIIKVYKYMLNLSSC